MWERDRPASKIGRTPPSSPCSPPARRPLRSLVPAGPQLGQKILPIRWLDALPSRFRRRPVWPAIPQSRRLRRMRRFRQESFGFKALDRNYYHPVAGDEQAKNRSANSSATRSITGRYREGNRAITGAPPRANRRGGRKASSFSTATLSRRPGGWLAGPTRPRGQALESVH